MLRIKNMITSTFVKKMLSCVIAGVIAVTASFACGYGWEQDACLDVQCPSGCTFHDYGATRSNCQSFPADVCCNCWYRERICWDASGNKCARATPPAPNAKFWDCEQETSVGPCGNDQAYGKTCLGCSLPPFGVGG